MHRISATARAYYTWSMRAYFSLENVVFHVEFTAQAAMNYDASLDWHRRRRRYSHNMAPALLMREIEFHHRRHHSYALMGFRSHGFRHGRRR